MQHPPGGDNERVRLNKLGARTARQRAKAATKELAEGLIKLYAERAKVKGYAFPPDDAWQREFEEDFPYEETDDQLRCIAEIKDDMQSDRPMDRLLCGDVGFGKTEVALRAVMKCILAGKQAAILVPTTVLARQHYLTAIQRFQGHPITIELLTRYKTGSEQTALLKKLEAGSVDLVIGTHKLFNKKIKFKDLGLLVVDEEQRFGVGHKETLKEMSKTWTLTRAVGNADPKKEEKEKKKKKKKKRQHGAVRYPRYVLHRGAAAEPSSGADVRA